MTPTQNNLKAQDLLKADYTVVEIIELCYIFNISLKDELYEVCAEIVRCLKIRQLTEYDKNLILTAMHDLGEYPFMTDLNGLLDSITGTELQVDL